MSHPRFTIMVNGREYATFERDQYGVWTDDDHDKVGGELATGLEALYADVAVFAPHMLTTS